MKKNCIICHEKTYISIKFWLIYIFGEQKLSKNSKHYYETIFNNFSKLLFFEQFFLNTYNLI